MRNALQHLISCCSSLFETRLLSQFWKENDIREMLLAQSGFVKVTCFCPGARNSFRITTFFHSDLIENVLLKPLWYRLVLAQCAFLTNKRSTLWKAKSNDDSSQSLATFLCSFCALGTSVCPRRLKEEERKFPAAAAAFCFCDSQRGTLQKRS